MRVVIEIQNGAQAGHKLLVNEQELIVFGRSEWSDVALKHDTTLANRHFSLLAQDGQVQLRDLGSETGTLVNDQPVLETCLRSGDIIRAGSTRFAAWIDGAADPAGAANPNGSPANRRPGFAAAWRGPIAFRSKDCDSGLVRLRGGRFATPQQPPSPAALASALAPLYPLTMIVDPQRVKDPLLAELPAAVPLFDWITVDPARPASPLVLPLAGHPKPDELVNSAWDAGGLVLVFSHQPFEDVVRHLQAATRLQVPAEDDDEDELDGASLDALPSQDPAAEAVEPAVANEPDAEVAPPAAAPPTAVAPAALLGFCWPAVLAPLLSLGRPALVTRLLDKIDCILLEIPERPRSWQLWCRPEFVKQLEKAGLKEV